MFLCEVRDEMSKVTKRSIKNHFQEENMFLQLVLRIFNIIDAHKILLLQNAMPQKNIKKAHLFLKNLIIKLPTIWSLFVLTN